MAPGAFEVTLKLASPAGPSLTTIQAPKNARMMPSAATTAPRARRTDAGTFWPHPGRGSHREGPPTDVPFDHNINASRRRKANQRQPIAHDVGTSQISRQPLARARPY